MFFWFDFHRLSNSLSKIGHHFRKQSVSKIEVKKNVLLKWYFLCKQIRMIFDVKKWLWKSDLGTFCQPMWESVKFESKINKKFYLFFSKNILPVKSRPKTPPLRSHYNLSFHKQDITIGGEITMLISLVPHT